MKQILCLDGGGMRGYLAAAILTDLERRSGRPCHELFDLIYGTSIGGIVGLLVGCGVPAAETLAFFTADGPHIFKKRFGHYLGLLGPRFRAETIEAVLQRRFQERLPQTRVGITAWDVSRRQPYFFKYAPGRDLEVPLWQAARATSSAQLYFPAFRTALPDGEHVFWDGGNVANNPAVCAYADAVKLWPRQQRVRVLSLGCGQTQTNPDALRRQARKLISAGLLRIGVETVEMKFEADSAEVDYEMTQFIGDRYVRIQPDLAQALPLGGVSRRDVMQLKDAAAAAVRAARPALNRFFPQLD